jgi:hypothetical protein
MGRPKKIQVEQVEPSTNEQWYLYLVGYWVPFPSSEYGGLQCVLARNKEEAKEAIKEEAGDFMVGSFKDADERIELRINKAEVFPVIGSYSEPHIVRSFET